MMRKEITLVILVLTAMASPLLRFASRSAQGPIAVSPATRELLNRAQDVITSISPQMAQAQSTGGSGDFLDPVTADTTRAVPLTDMAGVTYHGFEGGLYPGASNTIPVEHQNAQPAVESLDINGNPSATGKIVMFSIGMSNTSQEFCTRRIGDPCAPWTFKGQADADPDVNNDLLIVNGAQGGRAANSWLNPNATTWNTVVAEVAAVADLDQVQVCWLKQANFNVRPPPTLPNANADAYDLLSDLGRIVRNAKTRFPNLQQCYLSSRIYAGYASSGGSLEPVAYEGGYAVKWLIEAQINQLATGVIDPIAGDLSLGVAPWLAWGPYIWADGANPNPDGLTWLPSDYEGDLIHPNTSGEMKVAEKLLHYFKTSAHTMGWSLEVAPLNHWVNLVNEDPGPRDGHSMAYDRESDRVIMFGDHRTARNLDTWAYDILNNTWTNLRPASHPSSRAHAAAAYDAESDVIILHGGQVGAITPIGETWAYDFNTNTWIDMNPSGPRPPDRTMHQMAYDSHSDRIILYGGRGSRGSLGDTWAYDYNTNTWTDMTPPLPVPPEAARHALTYDSEHDRVILVAHGETWAYDYDNNRWEQRNATAPRYTDLGAAVPEMEYHSQNRRSILLNDDGITWAYDYAANSWTNMNTAPPPGLHHFQMVSVPPHDQIILYGAGWDWDLGLDGLATETWAYE